MTALEKKEVREIKTAFVKLSIIGVMTVLGSIELIVVYYSLISPWV